MANIYDMSDTWNEGSTTFTAIKMDVTDSASASDSLLMDLQVGGSSKFSVRKEGNLGIGTNPSLSFSIDAVGAIRAAQYNISSNTGAIYWSDLLIFRDAANTLAQRNGTNAQTFNLYNTYTDASNYERGFMKWNSNVLEIGTEAAGTGTARDVKIASSASARLQGSSISIGRLGWDFIVGTAANKLYFKDSALVSWGGDTSSYPGLKYSGTSLQARLADDSAFTNIQGKLTTETAYSAGAPIATGYIVLYDSTGTAYKVPAEAL